MGVLTTSGLASGLLGTSHRCLVTSKLNDGMRVCECRFEFNPKCSAVRKVRGMDVEKRVFVIYMHRGLGASDALNGTQVASTRATCGQQRPNQQNFIWGDTCTFRPLI